MSPMRYCSWSICIRFCVKRHSRGSTLVSHEISFRCVRWRKIDSQAYRLIASRLLLYKTTEVDVRSSTFSSFNTDHMLCKVHMFLFFGESKCSLKTRIILVTAFVVLLVSYQYVVQSTTVGREWSITRTGFSAIDFMRCNRRYSVFFLNRSRFGCVLFVQYHLFLVFISCFCP